jgi:hypothetical protein
LVTNPSQRRFTWTTEVDSFGYVYISAGDEEKIVMVCGYDGKNASYLNSVYEYNITKNKVSILFPGTKGT